MAKATPIMFFRHLTSSIARESAGTIAASATGAGAFAAANPGWAACAGVVFAGFLVKGAADAAKSKGREFSQDEVDAATTALEQYFREQRDLIWATAGLDRDEFPLELPPHFPLDIIRDNARDLHAALEAAKESEQATQAALDRLESLNHYVAKCLEENIGGVREALGRVEDKIDVIVQRLLAQNEQLSGTNAMLVGMLADKDAEINGLRADLRAFEAAKGEAVLDSVLEPEGRAAFLDFLEAHAAENESKAIEQRRRVAEAAYLIGEIDRAELNLKRILSAAPNDLDALNRLGHIYKLRGLTDESAKLYHRVAKLAPNDKWRAISLGNLAITKTMANQFNEARELLQKSYSIYKQLEDIDGMAAQIGLMAIIEHEQGDFRSALGHGMQSLNLSMQTNDAVRIAQSLGEIGLIYRDIGDLENAKKYFHNSLAANKALNRKEGIAIQLGNLGSVELRLNNITKAIEYTRESLDLNRELGRKFGVATQLQNLGAIELQKNNYDAAEDLIQQSLDIMISLQSNSGTAYLLGILGQIATCRGSNDKARIMWARAKNHFASADMPHMVFRTNALIAQLPQDDSTT